MILKKLILKDFGPVEGIVELPKGNEEFPSNGTIGITGRNGIGKTHVTAAIKYLLTGKTDKKMFTYVHGFGRKDPNKTTVEGVFENDGQEIVIKRTISISDKLDLEEIDKKLINSEAIKTKATASVKIGKSAAVRSASEVARIVEELTGIENSTHHDVIFVDQGRAGKILYATPAELQRSLHALSGAATCQKAVEAAQAMLPQLAVVDRTEELQDKQAQLSNIEVELKELDDRIGKLQAAKAELPDEQQARESLFALKKAAQDSDKIKTLQEELKAEQAVEADLVAKLEECKSLCDDLLASDTEAVKKAYGEAKVYLASLDSNVKLQEQKNTILTRIESLTAEYDKRTEVFNKLEKPEDNTEVIEAGLNQARQTLQAAQDFLDVFGKTGKCPTCGTEVQDSEALITNNENTVAEYSTRVNRLESELQDKRTRITVYERSAQDYNAWTANFSDRLEENMKALDEMSDIPELDRSKEADNRQVISDYEQLKEAYTQTENTRTDLSSKVEAAGGRISSVRDRISDLTATVSQKVEGDEDELDKIVSQHLDLTSKVSSCEGERTAKQSEYERCNREYAVLEAEQQQAAYKLKAKKLLEGVKAVMHRSAIPHDISSLYVLDVNARLQKYCDKLKLPFTLFLHPDNLSFMAMIEDATVPASQLSGGQTTMAAWAWHLSLYEKHGKSFGMLVMDEPTTGVDEANMENIAEALRYMNEYCSGAGIQLMMITHEGVLIPCFNHTENLN